MSAGHLSRQDIRLYIGEPLEHASDCQALTAICEALEKSHGWAYVFANFNVEGRQIDVAVFSEIGTLVVEAKGYVQPVKGGVNGNWTQVGPYGTRNLRNGYAQVLGAKNALRDAITGLFGPLVGYPNALLALVPAVPPGSSLPASDFKVSIGGLDVLEDALSTASGLLLSEDQCKALAAHLSLEPVSGCDAAMHEDVLSADRLLTRYESAFLGFHGPVGDRLLEDEYQLCGDHIGAGKVLEIAFGSRAALLVQGPSGCGKSLLSASIATQAFKKGVLPIHIQGKDFEGKIHRVLDTELGLLGSSFRELLRLSRIRGKQLVLFLDGYNECPESFRTTLTRSLRAFSLRYGAGVVLTSQDVLNRQELLSVEAVLVQPPSLALKSQLARLNPGGRDFANCKALLEIATSGLEAELIGQAAASLPVGASKFVLFDTVVRLRLGDAAAVGIDALSAFADELMSRTAFSLSVREFDRFSSALDVKDSTRRAMLKSRLVLQRGDRLSFSHEMFFSAFAAESAVRAAGTDAKRIEAALRSPRLHASKALIAGAIEDEALLEVILDSTTDQGLLQSCIQGECGDAARRAVTAKVEALLTEMIAEPSELRFLLNGEGWHSSAIEAALPRPNLSRFEALLPAIGWLLVQGLHVDHVIAACRAMEQKIVDANYALHEEARSKKVPLRHEIFSQAYVFNRKVAISQLMNFVHSGGLSFRHQPGRDFEAALKRAWSEASTHSEFYFLLGITKLTEHAAWAAPFVASLLERLGSLPYHLQLDAIDFCVYLRNVDDVVKARLIDALEKSLDKLGVMMNSIILEALKGLGALEAEEENYVAVVQREIDWALSESSPQADAEAWRLFSSQFDHPYDGTYWQQIQDLADDRKKQLLFKACRGAGTEYVSFVGILIRQLSGFGDPEVAEAIEPWLNLPSKKSVLPQDAIEAYLAAHEGMGKLKVPLPAASRSAMDVDEAMRACGELAYWACRLANSELESSPHTLDARNSLLARSASVSAGALLLSNSRMLASDGARINLVRSYPDTALAVCREALQHRHAQTSYQDHGFRDDPVSIATFSLQVIGQYGNADDLKSVRALCDDERLGRHALDAIKQIEGRIRYRHP